ncbi:MAG TPA: hypothetical protein VGN00_13750 [Puia sp.]|jgi:hypothetical protein
MSKKLEKKKRIFKLYSANLKNYLEAIGQQVVMIENGKIRDDVYICPLCYQIFFSSHLIQNSNENFLTLEHNPPKCMGGPEKILTCQNCNSNNGADYDKMVRDLLVTESFLFSNTSSITTKFTIDGNRIRGRIKKEGPEKGFIPDPKSNPPAYQALRDAIAVRKPVKVEHTLTSPDWKDYSMGMLKIAYLKAFELFGYHFADRGNGANIRQVLRGEASYPVLNNGVIDIFAPDNYVGVNVVVEPKELKALIITLPLHFKHDQNVVKKNIPVILPAPLEGEWDLLSNYNKFEDKEISYRTARYGIKTTPILNCRDYHSMFYDDPI